jgi:hypothetical protein
MSDDKTTIDGRVEGIIFFPSSIYLSIYSSSSFLFIALFLAAFIMITSNTNITKREQNEQNRWSIRKWAVMMMMIYVFLYSFDMMWRFLIFIIRLIVSCGIGNNG